MIPHEPDCFTSATGTTVSDNSQSWTSNEWTPGSVEESENGEGRTVAGNTGTTITVSQAWHTTPPVGTDFVLTKKSDWVVDNTFDEDNQNGNGTTSVEWDLS